MDGAYDPRFDPPKPLPQSYPYMPISRILFGGPEHNGDQLGWRRVYSLPPFVFTCGTVMLVAGLFHFRRNAIMNNHDPSLQLANIIGVVAGAMFIQQGLTVVKHIDPEASPRY
jgi:hypothetical protein